MKIKTILLLTALCASAVNFPAHAQEYGPLIVDGTAHPAESGTTYQAVTNTPALTVIGISDAGENGSYTGTNITLINNFTETTTPIGAYIIDQGQLSLTGGNITATFFGVLLGAASGTLNNVTINAVQNGIAAQQSTLNLTGGSITLSGMGSTGIALMGSTATVSGVNIDSEAYSMGVNAVQSTTLTLADSAINTAYSGVTLQNGSTGTLNNVNITTTMDNDPSGYGNGVGVMDSSTLTLTGGNINTSGSAAHGITLTNASTGTITDVNITATGQDAHALLLNDNSTATANLSNNTHLNGDITTTDNSTVNLTLTGNGSKLIGNVTQDATSTITLDISDGATLGDATIANTINGTVKIHEGGHISTTLTLTNGITLEAGAILDYAGNAGGLVAPGSESTIHIAESGVIVDFSGVTLVAGETYTIANFGDDYGSALYGESFTATGLDDGMTGTFYGNYTNGKLSFTATAIPEPSVYILLGIGLGILLITAHRRRRNQS